MKERTVVAVKPAATSRPSSDFDYMMEMLVQYMRKELFDEYGNPILLRFAGGAALGDRGLAAPRERRRSPNRPIRPRPGSDSLRLAW